MNSPAKVRRSAVSGLFYPADPEILKRDIALMLGVVEARAGSERLCGIIAPHAGYVYSGSTAASGYALLAGSTYDTVVIVSPSHRESFDGVSVYPGDAYATPLGMVRINAQLRRKLVDACDIVLLSEAGHTEEHAIEVQLPFLQAVLHDFSLLPLVMGNQSREICFALGEVLGSVLQGEHALLVASTDLSHYHSSKVADRLDAVVIEDVQRFDHQALMRDLEDGRAEACGGGPAVAVMIALQRLGARRMAVTRHSNSGDITGDHGSVVGYLSAVAFE
jgi:AmmeMemoRadiSam system protein B